MNKIKYFYWKPNRVNLKRNFGDEMTLWILKRMTDIQLEYVKGNYEGKFLSIGSIMNNYALNGDYIWGSGINGKILDNNGNIFFTPTTKDLKISAIRGHNTRDFLIKRGINCPAIYGDPGILFSKLYPEYVFKPKKGLIKVFSHYHDKEIISNNKFIIDNNIKIIHADWDFNRILLEVLECDFLISTALHGLVIADSFKIPNRYLRVSNKENLFKFDDYYSGTNRIDYKYGNTMEEVIRLGGVDEHDCDIESLINAFPFKNNQ